ncbi:MAG: thiamine biosynthesis protein ThiS [Candidatus Proteinoplasmatales archaeon SG8-5]|nr:MAG: thiamine biosynthesis protein ThiS [Candidatus Proteinoplasmatales archaeon SG8-5]
MGIKVNTKPVDWVEGETVTQLLSRMTYTFPLVVVKIDGEVIPKSEYPNTYIPDDSEVEVIHLISGG